MKNIKSHFWSILLIFFAVITLLCLIGLFFQDSYNFFKPSEWWGKLQEKSNNDRNTMFTLYYAILIGAAGIIFTSLSIHLSKVNITIRAFFADIFFCARLNICLLLLLSINSIIILFLGHIRYSVILNIYISFSLLLIIINTWRIISFFIYTEKEKSASKFLTNLIKNDNKKSQIFLKIVIKAFPNSYIEIIEKAMKNLLDNTTKEQTSILASNLKKFRLLYQQMKCSKEDLTAFLIMFNDFQIFIFNHNTFQKTKEDNLLIIFEVYKKMIFEHSKDLKLSYLLEIKEPSYYWYLSKQNNLNDEELKDFVTYYITLMNCAKDIIVLSLYHLDKNVIKNELDDFRAMIQFLNIDNKLRAFNFKSNIIQQNHKMCVDICTWIIDLILVNRINNSYLEFIKPLFDHVSEIFLIDADFIMYEEKSRSIDFHVVEYTRNFFITLMIIYLYKIKYVQMDNIIGKLNYQPLNNNKYHDRDDLPLLLREINKISKNHQQELQILGIENNFDDIKEALLQEIKQTYKHYLTELSKYDTPPLFDDALENYKTQLKNDIILYTKKPEQISTVKSEQILEVTVPFSLRQLTNDKSIIMLGSMSCSEFLINEMYNRYCKIAKNVTIIDFSRINIKPNDVLLMPFEYLDYLYAKESTFWDGDKLNINGTIVNVELMRTDFNHVVLLNDLLKYIWISEDGIKEQLDTDGNIEYVEKQKLNVTAEKQSFDIVKSCKINIKAQIDEDKTKTHKMYQVIF